MTGRLRYRYLRLLGAAVLVVWWERAWTRLWPAVQVAGLFVALAWLGAAAWLPVWLHILFLALFFFAFLGFLGRGLAGLGRVGRAEARARLERDSGLDHHPLTALEEAPVAGPGDPRAEALWQAHVARASATARSLRLASPAPGLARHDPLALRAAVLLLLIIGGVAGWGEWEARLKAALMPPLLLAAPGEAVVDVWLSPPAYTGRPPLHLSNRPEAPVPERPVPERPVVVPVGTVALVQTSGMPSRPWIAVGIGQQVPLARIGAKTGRGAGKGGHRGEAVIEEGARFKVGAGSREMAGWPLSVVADQAPEVRFSGSPTITREGRLVLGYVVTDDYGVTGLDLVVERAGDLPPGVEVEPYRQALPLARAARRGMGSGRAMPDLTAHAWAGLPATLVLEVRDARDQVGRTEPLPLTLPERPFSHPVARALIDIRRLLAERGDWGRRLAVEGLNSLATKPKAYDGDAVVHLSLRVARSRLVLDLEPEGIESVRALLWKTALRLEDGGLTLAERELDRQGEALRKALEQGAAAEELQRLAAALGRALDRFLEAMLEQIQRDGLPDLPPEALAQVLAGDALQQLIDEIRELAEGGEREAALERLDALTGMLQQMAAGLRDGPSRERLAEAARLMAELRQLEDRQRDLLDGTWQRLRERAEGKTTRPDRAAAADQRALSRRTEGLTRKVEDLAGERPELLDRALDSMEEATAALATGQGREAAEAQGQALEALRRARRGMGQALSAGGGMAGGLPRLFGPPARNGGRQDPFGRLGHGTGSLVGDGVKVPTEGQRKRVRAILDELRRRAGDASRPPEERDYIRRLLRRF